jgi:hypothetical protein
MGKKSGSRSGIRIRIIFLSALKPFFGVKILKFFEADPGWPKLGSGIRDGKNSDPGSGIRNKHPASATLQEI